ncbi:TPA: biopolymer transporter ExbD [Neisseria meningitidis]
MAFGSMNSGDDSPMSDINVTPLVDVMLVLLIVFMITMPVLTHSIPLELPTASEQTNKQDKQPKDPLRLMIDANGGYYVGGDSASKVEIGEVESRLKAAKEQNENVIVAIAADKAVEYDYVNKALEAARQAGITKIGFVTETKAQ